MPITVQISNSLRYLDFKTSNSNFLSQSFLIICFNNKILNQIFYSDISSYLPQNSCTRNFVEKAQEMEKCNGVCFTNLSSNHPITCFMAFTTIMLFRVLYVIYRTGMPLGKRATPQSFSTLIVLGSGGHTAEMINLLLVLQKDRFTPRFYIAAATDNMSLQKALVLDNSFAASSGFKGISAEFMQIYRSREVGQSYVTSVWTTLVAIAHAFWLMIKIRPQVVLCNGPGTCIPLCVIAFFFKVAGIRWSSIFYVESIARRKYPRAHYVGCLM
ncbi:UDP-N-acetylglucosamine transferase subunit ALG14 homolog isoform X2 [Durio zibethinus]|uniref:UDP-N-acetylglucosamine transferase subunit ALG14 n=1 Tax=Durio zibethinus TaxID=66656 RepID=A0A6P5WIK4_DURZI|nr:UDP-N-acetylglucosamine transferase subunit ALG14 homolog isoform X2 [Durio zibethinus]